MGVVLSDTCDPPFIHIFNSGSSHPTQHMKRTIITLALILAPLAAGAETQTSGQVIKANAALDIDSQEAMEFATDFARELFAGTKGSEFEILLGGQALKPFMGTPSDAFAKLVDAMATMPKLKVYACTETTKKSRQSKGQDAIKLPDRVAETECAVHFQRLKSDGWMRIEPRAIDG